jgi:transcriptional regulator with XRE-family HTH domain
MDSSMSAPTTITSDELRPALATLLSDHLKANRLSYAQLGRRCGLSQSAAYNTAKGRTGLSLHTLARLAADMGVPASLLLLRAEQLVLDARLADNQPLAS